MTGGEFAKLRARVGTQHGAARALGVSRRMVAYAEADGEYARRELLALALRGVLASRSTATRRPRRRPSLNRLPERAEGRGPQKRGGQDA